MIRNIANIVPPFNIHTQGVFFLFTLFHYFFHFQILKLDFNGIYIHRNTPIEYYGTTSAIEYAVSILKVKTILVCGHSNCGGLRVKKIYDNTK